MADLKQFGVKSDYIHRDSTEWDRCRLEELQYSAKNVAYKEDEVVRKVAPDFEKYIDVFEFLKYLQKRKKYISKGDEKEICGSTNSTHQCNKLVGLLTDLSTGSHGVVSDLLLSVMDSYEASEGGKSHYRHWDFAQILLDNIQHCQEVPPFKAPDVSQAILKLREVHCDEMKATEFARALGMQDTTLFSSISEVCGKWLEHGGEGCTFAKLVRALLLTPELGRHVTGLCPACRCNPPDVYHWFKSLSSEGWKLAATHFGFTHQEITSILTTFYSDQQTIPQIFLRYLRIPNIGPEFKEVFKHIEAITKISELPKGGAPGSQAVAGPLSHVAIAGEVVNQYRAIYGCRLVVFPQTFQGASPYIPPHPPVMQDLQANSECNAHGEDALQQSVQHDTEVESSLDVPVSISEVPQTSPTEFLTEFDEATRLLNACKCGDWKTAKLILQTEVQDVNRADDSGNTALTYALQCGADEIVDLLVSKGADISNSQAHVKQALELLEACRKRDWDLVAGILNSVTNFFEVNQGDGKTALHFACEEGVQEVVKSLVARGADVTKLTKDGLSLLNYPKVVKNEEILRTLLVEFSRKNALNLINFDENANHVTPLLLVCNEGDKLYGSAELLLENGANPNGSIRAYSRPLIVASERGFSRLVELLVAKRADLNSQDKDGRTALLQACRRKHFNIAQLLLEQPEINFNLSDKSGTSPLFESISANNLQFVEKLLDKGARLNASRQVSNERMMGSVEETPLAHACARGLEKIVTLLIDRGANVNFMCSDTVPPIGFAIIGHQLNIVRMLLKCNSLDSSIYSLSSSIIIAVKTENHECTRLLVDRLGGLEKALQTAVENQLEELATHLTMFMTADLTVSDTQDGHFKPREQMNPAYALSYASQAERENALEQFSHICILALRKNEEENNVTLQDLASMAGGMHPENPAIETFFTQIAYYTHPMVDLRRDFLYGLPSPLTFIISLKKVLTLENFLAEAEKHFDSNTEYFYSNLVAAFHAIQHGEHLPNNIRGVLYHLFEGQFQINLHSKSMYEPVARSSLGVEASSFSQEIKTRSAQVSSSSAGRPQFPGHGQVLGGQQPQPGSIIVNNDTKDCLPPNKNPVIASQQVTDQSKAQSNYSNTGSIDTSSLPVVHSDQEMVASPSQSPLPNQANKQLKESAVFCQSSFLKDCCRDEHSELSCDRPENTTSRRLQFSQHQAGIEQSHSVSENDSVTPESERECLPVSHSLSAVYSNTSSDSETTSHLGQDTREQYLPETSDQAQNSSAGSKSKVATPSQGRKKQHSPQVKRVSTDHTSPKQQKKSSPNTEKKTRTVSKIPTLCSKTPKGPTSSTTTSRARLRKSSEYQTQKSAPAGKESERVKLKPKRSKSEAKAVVEEVFEVRLDLCDLMISHTDCVLTIIYQLQKEYSHFCLKITCGDEIIWGRKLIYIRTVSDKKKLYQQLKLIIDGIRDVYPHLIEEEIDIVIYGVYYHQQ